MPSPTDGSGPSYRESTAFARLVACQDRRLDREGIPMYLALVSETAEPVPPPIPAQIAWGEQVARRLDDLRAQMASAQRDDDHSVLISVLQAVSYDDFDASRLPGGPPEERAPDPPIRPHGPRDEEAAL